MFHKWLRRFRKRRSSKAVNPDEIFIDSSNIPAFNKDQFEGRIETPISAGLLSVLQIIFCLATLIFVSRAMYLQVISGDFYFVRAERNNLKKELIFAHRGIIADRNDVPLAWNEESSTTPYDKRVYTDKSGFSNILGFVKYPGVDSSGHLYSFSTTGQDGIEKYYDAELAGQNGAKLSEVSVTGKIESQSALEPPQNGDKLNLSIDSRVQEVFHRELSDAAEKSDFKGAAGVIMDINTGEVIASVSYPGFDSNIMTGGNDQATISDYLGSKRQPFLDRPTAGLYAPGSIVKPYLAAGVLAERIINPDKQIFTVGYLTLPNPYDKEHPTIFKDWKDQGYVDLRKAIAVSSDVYFYIVGGGFGDQKGLGISKIDEYMHKFLFGTPTDGFLAGPSGTVPTPDWKKATFDGEDWRIGDTYHTAIGQYGFQVTPLQIVRAMSGIASDGTIVSPTIIKGDQGQQTNIDGVDKSYYQIIKEGMRMAVTEQTAIALNIPDVKVAAKTGTAQIGVGNSRVNSWVEGFFPYDNPRYAFAVVMENGPTTYAVSSMRAMSSTLSWMAANTPEYVGN
ncbi:MAG: penicillin-binding transpeptidase domain-containing protein [Patescibacteria group bacterium]